MNEINLIAAILTVAFYNGRGPALGLPQVLATYNELCGQLAEQARKKPRRRR